MRQCWKLVLAIVGIARLADAGLTSPHHAVTHTRHFAAAAEATYAAIATATAGATARNQSRHQLTSSTSMTAPPAIPKTFRSMVSITSTDSNTAVPLFGSVYTVAQNDVKKRQAFRCTTKIPFAPLSFVGTPLEWMNITSWRLAPGQPAGIDINGVLLNQSGAGYTSGLFAWLPFATDQGTQVFRNQTLNKWELDEPGETSLYLLVSPEAPNVPVLWSLVTPGTSVNYTFSGFDGSPPPDDDLWESYNATQILNPAPCAEPADKTPKSVNMYIFHPENNFDIGGQDLADATGDTSFTCIDVLLGDPSSMDHSYAWITAWSIELVPQWGQYQNCNGYGDEHTCLGANNVLVGHEAAEALGAPAGGQCVENSPDVGEWWSLPMAAECLGAGQAPGEDCSWKKSARLKTIDSKCLFQQHGFADLCKLEKRAPFGKARDAFTAAFASEDVAKGGCPAIVPHPSRG